MNNGFNNYQEAETCIYCRDRNVKVTKGDVRSTCYCSACSSTYYRYYNSENDLKKKRLEYRSARRVLEPEIERDADVIFKPKCERCGGSKFTKSFDNKNGYTYACKKCGKEVFDPVAKKQLDKLFALKNKYMDDAERDPIIQYLVIRLISKNYRIWNDEIRKYLLQAQAKLSAVDKEDEDYTTARAYIANIKLLMSESKAVRKSVRENIKQYIEESDENITVEDVFSHIKEKYSVIDGSDYRGYIQALIKRHKAKIKKNSPQSKEKRRKRAKVIIITLCVTLLLVIVALTTIYMLKPTILFGECKLEYYTDAENGEDSYAPITMGRYMQIDVPQKTGYTFAGLYDEEANGNMVINADGKSEKPYFTSKRGETITLYAYWNPIIYNVVIDTDGANEETPRSYTLTYGEGMQNLSSNLTKEGHTFMGWGTANGTLIAGTDGVLKSSYRYLDDAYYEIPDSACITLSAVWEINKYSVEYYSDDNILWKTIQVPYGTKINSTYRGNYVPDIALQESDYKSFHYWEDVDAREYMGFVNSDLTLIARWKYSIVFELKSDESFVNANTARSISASAGETVVLPKINDINGIIFKGWRINNNLVTTSIEMPVDGGSATSEREYIKYSISYEMNGGNSSGTLPAEYTVNGIDLPKLTKEGYGFKGWSIANIGTNLTSIPKGKTGNLTATAIFAKYYSIDYILAGGTLPQNAVKKYLEGEGVSAYNMPFPTKAGMVFAGWYSSPGGNGTWYNKISSSANSNLTLYANWVTDTITVTETNSIISKENHTKSSTFSNSNAYSLQIPDALKNMISLGYVKVDIKVKASSSLKYRSNKHNATLSTNVIINNEKINISSIIATGKSWPATWVDPAYGDTVENNSSVATKQLTLMGTSPITFGYSYELDFKEYTNWAGGTHAVTFTDSLTEIRCIFSLTR